MQVLFYKPVWHSGEGGCNNPQAGAGSDCKNLFWVQIETGFSPGYGIRTISLPCGFLRYGNVKRTLADLSNKLSRECLIKCIRMRVPIENGSGLSTRVSDFIKLSAAYRNSVYKNWVSRVTLFQARRWLFPHRRRIRDKYICHVPGR